MVKTAKSYSITFPYGATSAPYGTTQYPYHRGDDRPTPKGTPVVIEDVQIGLTGNSGYTTGPHLHYQEWKGNPYNDRKPQHFLKPGKVVTADSNLNQAWGKHITIAVGGGWNGTYAHLSEIYAKKGQLIKKKPAPPKGNVGKTIYLPKSATTWRIYATSVTPVIGNEYAFLAPKKYGGLKYKIVATTKWADVHTIKTQMFGKKNIWVGKGSEAVIK
jgi:hypothetical protein